MVDADKLVDRDGQPLLPTVAAETIVFDHGKVYLSNHIQSVCAKLDISLQPARPKTPTDKPVERWFRTLNQGLLAALPGYKGSDVHSCGEKVEDEAFFFIDELSSHQESRGSRARPTLLRRATHGPSQSLWERPYAARRGAPVRHRVRRASRPRSPGSPCATACRTGRHRRA